MGDQECLGSKDSGGDKDCESNNRATVPTQGRLRCSFQVGVLALQVVGVKTLGGFGAPSRLESWTGV